MSQLVRMMATMTPILSEGAITVGMRRLILGSLVIAMGTVLVPSAVAADQTVGFNKTDYIFLPERVAIKQGESVTWKNDGSDEEHNVHFEDARIGSPQAVLAKQFTTAPRSFPVEGAYRYYCENHGSPGGVGMFGFVYVNATGELPPLAKFTAAPNPAVAGQPVTFDAKGSSATNSSIVKYEWDLNGNGMYGDPDDKTSTTPTTSQTYLTAQDLTVKLRVTDSRGATDVTTRPVRIDPAPTSTPDPTPNPQPTPQPQPSQTTPQPVTILPGPTPPDRTPGTFSFRAPPTSSRAAGAAVKVTCGGGCRFTATLTISASVARKARLGAKATTIGTARGTLVAAGSRTMTVKLTSKARQRLARFGSVPATLKLAVVDASGATTRKQKSVKLSR